MVEDWRWTVSPDRVGRTQLVDPVDPTKIILCAGGNKLLSTDPKTGALLPIDPLSKVGRMLASAPHSYDGFQRIQDLVRQIRAKHPGAEVGSPVDDIMLICIDRKVHADAISFSTMGADRG